MTDWVPLRIELLVEHWQGETLTAEQATVDYVPTPQGHLAPASVTQREEVAGLLTVENLFQYSDWSKQ